MEAIRATTEEDLREKKEEKRGHTEEDLTRTEMVGASNRDLLESKCPLIQILTTGSTMRRTLDSISKSLRRNLVHTNSNCNCSGVSLRTSKQEIAYSLRLMNLKCQ
jgi:hypothetical protein